MIFSCYPQGLSFSRLIIIWILPFFLLHVFQVIITVLLARSPEAICHPYSPPGERPAHTNLSYPSLAQLPVHIPFASVGTHIFNQFHFWNPVKDF